MAGHPAISPRSIEVVQWLRNFAARFPAETLEITEILAPENEFENDYFIEVSVTLRPACRSAFDVTFNCCEDSTGFGIMHQSRLAAATGLKTRGQMGWHSYCIFTEPWTGITIDGVSELCETVATGRVTATIGAVGGRLIAMETKLERPLALRSSLNRHVVGPLWFVRGMSHLGWAEIRPFTPREWSATP